MMRFILRAVKETKPQVKREKGCLKKRHGSDCLTSGKRNGIRLAESVKKDYTIVCYMQG